MRMLKTAAFSVAMLAFCLVGMAAAQSIQITSGPTVQQVSSNSAVITWTTNAASSTKVLYGTSKSVLEQQVNSTWPDQNRQPTGPPRDEPGLAEQPWGSTTHTVQLTNLQPGSKYYYAVRSGEAQGSGAATTSSVLNFDTQPVGGSANNSGAQTLTITSNPTLQNVTGNSAVVTWTTNAPASTMVMFGTDPNTLQAKAAQPWPQQDVAISGTNPGVSEQPWGRTDHSATISGLQPNTTYYYIVRSESGLNTGTAPAVSTIYSFKTPAQ